MEYVYKMTSELTVHDVDDILSVLNTTFGNWGDKKFFQWKYHDNPYGNSLHMIAYDSDLPVATMAFWRNDLSDVRAYNCADLAVLSSHHRRGIFRQAEAECIKLLEGAYIYNIFSNSDSLAGFFNFGWTVQRKAALGFHLTSSVLQKCAEWETIPDWYAEWRFVRHPSKEYNICRLKEKSFLVSKRQKGVYLTVGPVPDNFGLHEVHPLVLFSYDLPDLPFRLPRKARHFIEKPCYVTYDGFLPGYKSDVL